MSVVEGAAPRTTLSAVMAGLDPATQPDFHSTMTPTVKYDPASNAAYIRFSPEPVEESEEVSDGIVLDHDAEGRIVGLDVMDARAHLPPDLLEKAA